MPRVVVHHTAVPLKVDPNLEPGQTPPAPNVVPWPRDEQGRLKVLSICTCGISAKFPLCDGAHKSCIDEDPAYLYEYDAQTRQVRSQRPLTPGP